MQYDFKCTSCDAVWEETLLMSKRDEPVNKPCPECGKLECVRRLVAAPATSYTGRKGARAKAGHEWNGILKQIKKNAGRKSTIETM